MAKVMWLGEDTEEIPGPSYHIWNGVKFPKDVWVELTDAHMLGKARNSRFYKVTEDEAPHADDVVDVKTAQKPRKEYTEAYEERQEWLRKERQYGAAGAREITPKEETQHAQGKALERKAQELKSKVETKKEDYDFRKAEKGSGYSPQKLKAKVKEAKAASRSGVSAPHARPDSTDTDAA